MRALAGIAVVVAGYLAFSAALDAVGITGTVETLVVLWVLATIVISIGLYVQRYRSKN